MSRVDNLLQAAEASGIFMKDVCGRSGVPWSTVWRWKKGGSERGTAAIDALEKALSELIDEKINSLPDLKKTLQKARALITPEPATDQTAKTGEKPHGA